MNTYTVTINLYDYTTPSSHPVHVGATRMPDIQAVNLEAAQVMAETLYPLTGSLVELSYRLEMQIGLINT